ncbi:MAG: acyltransferase 3 [Phenylobacterium sp.]|jgi:peptidoglycan/LPS O-acetylase OafA/YrhL|nr:acyltransferase 3 [Phenylobacterium sp.]
MRRGQIVGLDLVRFSAAVLVMLYHMTYWISAPAASSAPEHITGGVFHFTGLSVNFGWVGVEIFFVLSGFVISYSASQSDAFRFLKGRALRLAPAAWICASVTLLVSISIGDVGVPDGVLEWTRSVLFYPSGPWIDGVYWTLGIEVSFYVLIFALLWAGRFRNIEGVASTIGLLSTAFWLVWLLAPSSALASLADKRIWELLLVRHGCEFSVGVMLWLCAVRGLTTARLTVLLVCCLGGAIEIAYTAKSGRIPGGAAAITAWMLAIGLMAASVRWNARLAAWPAADRWARRLGLATYPLYLSHQVVGAALMAALWRLGLSQVACLLITLVAAVAFSVAVAEYCEPAIRKPLAGLFALIERPVRRLLDPQSA